MGLDIDIYRANTALISDKLKQYNKKYTGYDKPKNKEDLKIFKIIESAETIGYLRRDYKFLKLVNQQLQENTTEGRYLLLNKEDCRQIYKKPSDKFRNKILKEMINSDNNTILIYYSF